MQQRSCVRVPHFDQIVVDSGDDGVVMAIPGHHGDLGLERVVPYCFRPGDTKMTKTLG